MAVDTNHYNMQFILQHFNEDFMDFKNLFKFRFGICNTITYDVTKS